MPVLLRKTRAENFAGILTINRESAPHVARLELEELQRLVALADVAWVASRGTDVVGYLLAMSSASPYDGEEFKFFLAKLDEPFLYVDQIAIATHARRSSIASRMYRVLTRWSRQRNIARLCCEVNIQPPNAASLQFHEEAGFVRFGELETVDGRHVALLCKDM
jgi:uncharacterized protein